MKISKTWQKVCVGVLSLVVLLFAGYGVKTAADEFWGGHEAVEEINHNIDLLSGNLQQRNVELKNTKGLLKEARKNNGELEKELQKKQHQIDDNTTKMNELKENLQTLKDENKRLAADSANDKLAYDREVTNLNKWIGKLQDENDANLAEIARLKQENADVEKQIETLEGETEEKDRQIDGLEDELEKANKDLKKAKKERDDYKQGKEDNDKFLEQAEEDARGTLKKTHDALDDNDIQGDDDNQN